MAAYFHIFKLQHKVNIKKKELHQVHSKFLNISQSKTLVGTIFHKTALKKSSKVMWWFGPEFLLEYLLLHIKSSSTHEHLCKNDMLSLADPDHVQRLSQGLPCKLGSKISLHSIGYFMPVQWKGLEWSTMEMLW